MVKTIVCGYGRIDGWAVGIVANQRLIVKTKKARCRWVVLFIMTAQTKEHDLS
jgi:acetyl-CoA carboxylase carboxyltransferase component